MSGYFSHLAARSGPLHAGGKPRFAPAVSYENTAAQTFESGSSRPDGSPAPHPLPQPAEPGTGPAASSPDAVFTGTRDEMRTQSLTDAPGPSREAAVPGTPQPQLNPSGTDARATNRNDRTAAMSGGPRGLEGSRAELASGDAVPGKAGTGVEWHLGEAGGILAALRAIGDAGVERKPPAGVPIATEPRVHTREREYGEPLPNRSSRRQTGPRVNVKIGSMKLEVRTPRAKAEATRPVAQNPASPARPTEFRLCRLYWRGW